MTRREPSDPSPHNGHAPQSRGPHKPKALPQLEALLNQTRPDPIDDARLSRILDKVEALRGPCGGPSVTDSGVRIIRHIQYRGVIGFEGLGGDISQGLV